MFYEETIICLLDEMIDKDKEISENAFKTLNSLIYNSDNMLLLNAMNWDEIFTKLSEVFTVKYEYAQLFCKILKEKYNKQQIYEMLHQINEEDVLMLCFNLFQFNHRDRIEFNKYKECN